MILKNLHKGDNLNVKVEHVIRTKTPIVMEESRFV